MITENVVSVMIPSLRYARLDMGLAQPNILAILMALFCALIVTLLLIIRFNRPRKMYLAFGRRSRTIRGDSQDGKPEESEASPNHVLQRLREQPHLSGEMYSAQLQEYFLIKLLQGELGRSAIAEKIKQAGVSDWTQLAVIVFQTDGLEQTRYEPVDEDIILFAMHNIISEVIPDSRRLRPVLLNRGVAVLAGAPSQEEQAFAAQVLEEAKAVQQAVKQYLGLSVSAGVSRVFQEMKDGAVAYRGAITALEYRIRCGGGVVLRIEDMEESSGGQPIYPKHLEVELLEAVQSADQERSEGVLSEFMTSVTAGQGGSYRDCQLFLLKLLISLMDLAGGYGTGHLLPKESALLERFFSFRSAVEMEQWLKAEMISPLVRYRAQQEANQDHLLSDQIKKLIHENYHTELTLEACAASLNFNPDYLRQVFRKQTGETFSDYLARYRLKMAKQMLRETDMKITEIAQRLGYNNAQNFIRYFRKMEGITPGQYREQRHLSS
ncbi:helix-turn-helix transcriptional regulator [Paenibacillus sp. y28]|uniref:helix-turn-helix transcriptional regulator n=1 Tax=Paenibacillus sp. y28 TaxID=3129110 RepID=UPI003016919E